MLGDGNLAKMIEDAIAGFLEGGENSGMMAMNGAYVQRSVTITVTTLRYTEMQRSQENGDILAASELQTSLRDKIGEMIQQLFGAGSRGEESESETSGDAGNDGDSVPSRNRTQWGSGAVSMWSMELFYSMTAIQGQGAFGTGSGSGEASGYNVSGSFSRFSASYGSFSALTSNRLPSLLSQFMGGGSESGGGLSGFLEEALSGFGLSGGSYRQTSEGFSFKVSQSRNLIAELMELYGDRIGQNNAAAAEAAEEEPAEAVAAAG